MVQTNAGFLHSSLFWTSDNSKHYLQLGLIISSSENGILLFLEKCMRMLHICVFSHYINWITYVIIDYLIMQLQLD